MLRLRWFLRSVISYTDYSPTALFNEQDISFWIFLTLLVAVHRCSATEMFLKSALESIFHNVAGHLNPQSATFLRNRHQDFLRILQNFENFTEQLLVTVSASLTFLRYDFQLTQFLRRYFLNIIPNPINSSSLESYY